MPVKKTTTKRKVGRPRKVKQEDFPTELVEVVLHEQRVEPSVKIVKTKWAAPPVRDNLHGREVVLDCTVDNRKYKAHIRNNVSGKALFYIFDRGTNVCVEFDSSDLLEAINGLFTN